ncbi:Clp protease N-terminal domain-containing protein [Streptomyces cyaneofuscatus]|uniref:Clp protease N-terminal domain-containing protein n=1 Tax=Streptomyces cyaneofuscatus TaxID=66883 RepID=A0ABZ1F1W7_9ACTN|nr:Clp protease N-terminal domain-containing protein [Streptomyces cyaneofuscatus]WSB10337.1 Clp protease N-terminal domain-containing protein [Streptomyces cyaneofuscatus]WSD46130.1 Clp protease N-terminal domain-containing protein [Streptomyces cyaneofuscatus]WTA89505.1 Clp protease N-terminal domain-containing protein [Streptomyces cyaneofuscatus]
MFERFTQGARATVKGAVAQAERVEAGSVTEEHLLLALLEQEGSRASFALAALGLSGRRASLDASFTEARRRGGLTKADTEALAGIGIDVGAIVDRVEGAHGEGALAADRGSHRWWSGHRAFTPGAKSILEKSLRVALGRGDRFIGEEHLLLALTAAPGTVADVLAEHGATYATVHRALYGPEADGRGHAEAG